MRITCPHCQTLIPTDQLNMQHTLAACPNCHQVFDFRAQMEYPVESPEKPKRRKVKQPSDMLLQQTAAGLEIRYHWNPAMIDPSVRSVAFNCVLAGLVLWAALGVGHVALGGLPEIAVIIIGVLLGLPLLLGGLTFYAAHRWNHTHLLLDGERLRVESGPIPYNGVYRPRQLAVQAVSRFGVELSGSADANAGSASRFYNLVAYAGEQQKVVLVRHIPEGYAAFMAQELNAELETSIMPAEDSTTEAEVPAFDLLSQPTEAIQRLR